MISIIIPLYNEEESLLLLYKELVSVVRKISPSYELIFIDDGSTDSSLEILKDIAKKDSDVKIYAFRKNLGKAEALSFGFQKAKGDYVITLDADLQDRPSEIPKLIDKSKEGWDLVCGWRRNRQDSFQKVLASKFFNFLARSFWGLNLHDYNCGLKVYTNEAAKSVRLYGGFYRFIPLLVYQQGFSVTEVSVVHEKRKFGKSKYGFSKLWKDLPDIFTMLFLARYSTRPLHFFGIAGGLMFTAGFIIFGYLSILWFSGGSIGRRPLLLFSVLLMLGGLQIFFTGFLAELITNINHKKEVHFPLKYTTEKQA